MNEPEMTPEEIAALRVAHERRTRPRILLSQIEDLFKGLDETEVKILTYLIEHPHAKHHVIAKSLGMARAWVTQRMNRPSLQTAIQKLYAHYAAVVLVRCQSIYPKAIDRIAKIFSRTKTYSDKDVIFAFRELRETMKEAAEDLRRNPAAGEEDGDTTPTGLALVLASGSPRSRSKRDDDAPPN